MGPIDTFLSNKFSSRLKNEFKWQGKLFDAVKNFLFRQTSGTKLGDFPFFLIGHKLKQQFKTQFQGDLGCVENVEVESSKLNC